MTRKEAKQLIERERRIDKQAKTKEQLYQEKEWYTIRSLLGNQ